MMTNWLKRLIVPSYVLMDLLGWKPGSRLVRPWHPDVPADAEVVSICQVWERRSFGLVIAHESFPEVPDGDLIPEVPPLDWRAVEITAVDLGIVDDGPVQVSRG